MNRRELFGVTAGAVAAACLPEMPVAKAVPGTHRWYIAPGSVWHLGPGENIQFLDRGFSNQPRELRIDFANRADVKFYMTEPAQ